MAQKNYNLDKWTHIGEGEVLTFVKDTPRNVAIDVNVPGEAYFYVLVERARELDEAKVQEEIDAGRLAAPATDESREGNVSYFLGLAKGRDRFEFAVLGAFQLYVENCSAYISSSDGEMVHTTIPLHERPIFTRVANRKKRNPHLEMIEYNMRLNQQRFMEDVEAEIERRTNAIEERYADDRAKREVAAKLARKRPPLSAEDGTEGTIGDDSKVTADADEGGSDRPSSKKRKSPANADEPS